jgi:hypothetical protein
VSIAAWHFTDDRTLHPADQTPSVLLNSGTASTTDSEILRNRGGLGAIVNTRTITLTNVTFRDNVPADCDGCGWE